MREIVLDTETTGISVKEGHRIVEIACVELENLIPTGKKFHCCLNPERKVTEQAFKIHGFSDIFLSKQKKFSEIKDDFLNFIKDKKLIIHNAEFDLAHLNNELSLAGNEKISDVHRSPLRHIPKPRGVDTAPGVCTPTQCPDSVERGWAYADPVKRPNDERVQGGLRQPRGYPLLDAHTPSHAPQEPWHSWFSLTKRIHVVETRPLMRGGSADPQCG